MVMDWNTAGDFSSVVDTLEPLILVRRTSADEVAIPHAWRFADQTAESDTAGGWVGRHDAVWQFEWDDGEPLPELGDRLVDQHGESWTIRVMERHQGSSRWRIGARNLAIAYGLDRLIAIEQGVWEEGEEEPELVGWQTLYPALRARVQPYQVNVEGEGSVATFHVLLEESIPLDHRHRIVDAEGNHYRVVRYERAERIDVLPQVTVELVE